MANERTIQIAADGISNSGKAFANSSSLCLMWELTNCDALAFWDDYYELGGSRSGWERFLVLQNESGLVLLELFHCQFYIIILSCYGFTCLLIF